jgi:hypothetical protein
LLSLAHAGAGTLGALSGHGIGRQPKSISMQVPVGVSNTVWSSVGQLVRLVSARSCHTGSVGTLRALAARKLRSAVAGSIRLRTCGEGRQGKREIPIPSSPFRLRKANSAWPSASHLSALPHPRHTASSRPCSVKHTANSVGVLRAPGRQNRAAGGLVGWLPGSDRQTHTSARTGTTALRWTLETLEHV